LELQTPLEHGHAIRIESGDHAFLGEAVWCHGRVETHLVRVKFDQVLSGLAALGRMLEQFSDEPLGPEAVHSLHDRHQQDH
jgi:hypothetical protein